MACEEGAHSKGFFNFLYQLHFYFVHFRISHFYLQILNQVENMKISLSNLVDLAKANTDSDLSKMNQNEKNGKIDLGMDIAITSWPGITLEISEYYYNIFW